MKKFSDVFPGPDFADAREATLSKRACPITAQANRKIGWDACSLEYEPRLKELKKELEDFIERGILGANSRQGMVTLLSELNVDLNKRIEDLAYKLKLADETLETILANDPNNKAIHGINQVCENTLKKIRSER